MRLTNRHPHLSRVTSPSREPYTGTTPGKTDLRRDGSEQMEIRPEPGRPLWSSDGFQTEPSAYRMW